MDTRYSRRNLLKQIVIFGRYIPFANLGILPSAASFRKEVHAGVVFPPQASSPLRDDPFLEELERANFRYFWEQANPETGLVRDRYNVRQPTKSDLASIAATGFGLTALCIGERRGYVSHAEARVRAANTLRFLWKKMQDHRGFFYHFANVNNG